MKGRSKELVTARDKRMYERYAYWTEVRRVRFDDALAILSKREFFLSEQRILAVIRRLAAEGYEPENGPKLSRPRFTGLRGPRREAAKRRKAAPAAEGPSLFPEEAR